MLALRLQKNIVIQINGADHIQIYALQPNGDVQKNADHVYDIETLMQEDFSFAYSSQFCYLTSDPLICGTAMQCHTYLHVPMLLHSGQLQKEVDAINADISVQNMQNESLEHSIGDVIILKNRYTLVLSEDKILSSLQKATKNIASAEQHARTAYKAKNPSAQEEWKDKIAKAVGLLLYSRTLSAAEGMNAISLCMLGTDFGWLQGCTLPQLRKLFFQIQRGHLTLDRKAATYLQEQELEIQRAQLVQQKLASLAVQF